MAETLSELLSDLGIEVDSHKAGVNQRALCPHCSAGRRKSREKCLVVRIDDDGMGVTWDCKNGDCGNPKGGARIHSEQHLRTVETRPRKVEEARPLPVTASSPLPPDAMHFFEDRGISKATLEKNGVYWTTAYFSSLGCEVPAIAFPFRFNGEVVNVKQRTPEKQFAQTKGGLQCLYGIDDIGDADTLVIVEGEIDKLSLNEIGMWNVVSVPAGAPAMAKKGEPSKDDARFQWLSIHADRLGKIQKFIIATDGDGPGEALADEIARRLDRLKCYRVTWPDGQDVVCKDGNDVLRFHGPQSLRECIENAKAYPVVGLYEVGDYRDAVFTLYREGMSRGVAPGWPSLDKLYSVRPGDFTAVTGYPNGGKSEFLDALTMNLAMRHGWKFALCSFENAVDRHISKLAQKWLGLPFFDGPSRRMAETELGRALDWVQQHYFFIRFHDESATIDAILEKARAAVLRHGIRGLILDPFNEIEHARPSNMNETEYVSQMLAKVKRFAQNNGVHTWFVAHPTKPSRDSVSNGRVAVPGLHDISGSAHWANKSDWGLVVHRDPKDRDALTEIWITKVRDTAFGEKGTAYLRYDRRTGRYIDQNANETVRKAG
jgi:twinkle protein